MQRLKPDVDVVLDVLNAVLQARPGDAFTRSLLQQYRDRGGLSKKQLEGLHGKAQKIAGIPAGKLATIEAIILRKKRKYRSGLPVIRSEENPDDASLVLIDDILARFPGHKRVLFFKTKLDGREPLTPLERSELEKFSKLLTRKE